MADNTDHETGTERPRDDRGAAWVVSDDHRVRATGHDDRHGHDFDGAHATGRRKPHGADRLSQRVGAIPPTTRRTRGIARRSPDTGVTLVEMLVVLAIVGVMAAAVGLSIGSGLRRADAGDTARLLAARLDRAAEITAITGTPSALIWNADSYRFLSRDDAGWAPHPAPLLAAAERLPRDLRWAGPGDDIGPGADIGAAREYVLSPGALPAPDAAPLELVLWGAGNDTGWVVTHDGATATARPMTRIAP